MKILLPVDGSEFTKRMLSQVAACEEPGDAADSIAGLAGAGGYDLVVMGKHGHSALCNVLLGSVAAGVLAKCKVPVLLLR